MLYWQLGCGCGADARVVVAYPIAASASGHGVTSPYILTLFFKGLKLVVGRTRANFTLFSFDLTLWPV